MNLLLLPRYDLVTLIIAMSLSVATSRSRSGTNGRSPVRSGGRLRVEGGCARRTALVQLEDQPGRQAPRMGVAIVENGGRASAGGVAWLVRVQRAIAPEQVQIAWNQLQPLRPQQPVADGCADQLATQCILQQRLLEHVQQNAPADAAQIGKHDQIAPIDSLLRDLDRQQHGHEAGIVMKAVGFAAARISLDAAQYFQDLAAIGVPPGARPINIAKRLSEFGSSAQGTQ